MTWFEKEVLSEIALWYIQRVSRFHDEDFIVNEEWVQTPNLGFSKEYFQAIVKEYWREKGIF